MVVSPDGAEKACSTDAVREIPALLLRELRGGGLGTRLMHRLLNHADQLGLPTSLHVEPFNPAQRLYLRLGYVTRETRGIYHFMERPVGAGQLKIAS
mgnify:CR=1 FL=1